MNTRTNISDSPRGCHVASSYNIVIYLRKGHGNLFPVRYELVSCNIWMNVIHQRANSGLYLMTHIFLTFYSLVILCFLERRQKVHSTHL